MKALMFPALSVALLIAGCSSSSPTGAQTSPGKITTASPIIITQTENAPQFAHDPAQIMAMSIEGDLLKVSVTYSGGCEDHEFQLHTSGALMKSYPPQMNIRLAHDAKGDVCRAVVSRDLVFDLSPLRNAYKAYNTLILHLYAPDAPAPEQPELRYILR